MVMASPATAEREPPLAGGLSARRAQLVAVTPLQPARGCSSRMRWSVHGSAGVLLNEKLTGAHPRPLCRPPYLLWPQLCAPTAPHSGVRHAHPPSWSGWGKRKPQRLGRRRCSGLPVPTGRWGTGEDHLNDLLTLQSHSHWIIPCGCSRCTKIDYRNDGLSLEAVILIANLRLR